MSQPVATSPSQISSDLVSKIGSTYRRYCDSLQGLPYAAWPDANAFLAPIVDAAGGLQSATRMRQAWHALVALEAPHGGGQTQDAFPALFAAYHAWCNIIAQLPVHGVQAHSIRELQTVYSGRVPPARSELFQWAFGAELVARATWENEIALALDGSPTHGHLHMMDMLEGMDLQWTKPA